MGSKPPRHLCGYLTGRKRHEPYCTAAHRKVEGCWCFLSVEGRPPSARQWRAERRRVSRERRVFNLTLKRTGNIHAAYAKAYRW